MTYSSSQSVSLGTAFDVSTDSVGWKAGGTVSRSSSFTASWDASAANRSYTLESELGKYKEVCYIVSGGSSSYAYTKYSFVPIKLTGGYSTAGTANFTANYCTGALAAGTWTRNQSNGSAWTLSSGFDISGLVGFDVTSTSNWDTSNALSYKQPTAGLYKLCGNNDWPAYASRVIGHYA